MINLLERSLRLNPNRELAVVLARELANTPMRNQERHAVLHRIFRGLTPVQQLRCRDELHWCQKAKRGQLTASVSAPR